VQGVAANVASLEALLTKAKRAGKSDADAARRALETIQRGATSLATSVRDAEKQGRAAKGATYPTAKPMAAAALVAYLGTIEKDAKSARIALDKKYPAPVAPAKAATAKAATTKAATPKSATATAAPTTTPAPAAPVEPVCEPGQIDCDNGNVTCCAGERCHASGYIVYSEHFEADYYQCMDPAFAPAPPTL
jgi:hypothetical protein